MTREEFFAIRARMDYEKHHPAHVCAPGPDPAADAPSVRLRANKTRRTFAHAVKAIHEPRVNSKGEGHTYVSGGPKGHL